jgi:hypothetical protein
MSGIEDFLKENYQATGQWSDLQLLEAGTSRAAR